MMYHVFLVISIVVIVSGHEESKDSTTFRDCDMNALIDQIQKLSFENKEIVNFNSKILRENENLKHSIQNLERRVYFVEQNIPIPNSQQSKQEFESSIQSNLFKNLTKNNSPDYLLTAKMNYPVLMSKKVNDNNHTRVKRATSGVVAFSGVVKDTLHNIGDHQEIPFKTVVIDTHSAFHADSGIFTSPAAGYYAVFSTIMTLPGIRLDFLIVRNGNAICYGYSKGLNGDDKLYGTGSTSGIVYLAVGDKIWVKVHEDHHYGSGEMVLRIYSSFMGYRL
ncbi:Hypothetical predicted protein [Mytilus galloprovincialis]|uniref:C1q domain-containing protein n=1 Tax=Mytilus galloprovincialis TaxID=29158 RepID=A0A8B6BDL6_MYTGA|nr:Hypothetical predicted protein [Mytilus galloprovincialis]